MGGKRCDRRSIFVSGCFVSDSETAPLLVRAQQKRRPKAAFLFELAKVLQRRFDLKSPGL
jgi:hypothetical protein